MSKGIALLANHQLNKSSSFITMSKSISSFWALAPVLLVAICTLNKAEGHVGVVYSPFVKPDDAPFTTHLTQSYTIQDVKVMLDLIADDNFTSVTTIGVGAPNEPYQVNSTRYRCTSVVHTALAAAEINKERKTLALSMYQGIWAHKFSPERLNTEIEVGFEQVQAANRIFNETVPGIVFPTNVAFGELLEKENIIKTVSARARKQNLTMGVRVYDCHTAMAQAETGHFEMIRNLVALYDFIICQMVPPAANYSLGPERFFKEITKEFSEVVKAVKLMGNATQVILESGWANASNESNSKETTELKWFWERMGQWANAEKQNVFMADAFDNPWKNAANQLAAHYGLWMHLDTDNNSKEAYVRKVPDLHIQKYRKPQPPPISVGLDGNNKTKTATKSQVSEGHAGSNKTTVKPKLYYATRNGANGLVNDRRFSFVAYALYFLAYFLIN